MFIYGHLKRLVIYSWPFLLPKGEATKGSHFRPITYMSNFYKLMTKCVTKTMQLVLE